MADYDTNVPQQLPVPSDTTFSGDNWGRNLALFGGQIAAANNQRFGAGFLQNPGSSALAIGIANGFGAVGNLDSQASNTQNTLAEAETKRIGNIGSKIGLEQYKQFLADGSNGGPMKQVPTSILDGQTGSAKGETNSASADIAGPTPLGQPKIIPQDRLLAMTTQSAKDLNLPPQLATMFAQGIVPTESSGNADPALVNPKSGAFGLVGLLPSTVRDPGFGMKGQDPELLKNDPQAQLNFGMEYAYRRATAPIDKGGLGMTAADFDNPGMMAHVAAMYGGATTDAGKQQYVGTVANHILRNTGRPQYAQQGTPEQMMAAAARPGAVGVGGAARLTPQEVQAGMGQVQQQQQADAQTQAQVNKPYQVASNAPTAPPTQQPTAQPTNPNAPSPEQVYAQEHNVGGTGGTPEQVLAGLRAQNDGQGPMAAQTPPQGAAPQAAPMTPAPSTKPIQVPNAAPVAPSGTVPMQPATGTPVAQPGSRAEQQAQAQSNPMIAPGMPRSMVDTINRYTDQAQQNYAEAVRLQAAARFNPAFAPLALQYQQRGMAAQESAMKLKNDFELERAKAGTWAEATHNGISGQQNNVTGEFKPYTTSSGRSFVAPDGKIYVTPPGGGAPQLVVDANNPGVAGKAAAEHQGAGTGDDAAKLVPKLIDMVHTSNDGIANIDVGMAALKRGAVEGAPTGYFAPWRLKAAAMGKSLGITIPGLDISPDAVGDLQTAEKTLNAVGGGILQTVLGKGEITEGKLAHFIHLNPSLLTDPDAIEHILGWARQQYQYKLDMGMDGLRHQDPVTGMIPPSWYGQYIVNHGAGAIFDTETGGTKQPSIDANGQPEQPPRDMPTITDHKAKTTEKPTTAAPYNIGDTATGPNGKKMTYTAQGWK